MTTGSGSQRWELIAAMAARGRQRARRAIATAAPGMRALPARGLIVILIGIYCAAELAYNLALIDSVTTPSTPAETASVAVTGKFLAAAAVMLVFAPPVLRRLGSGINAIITRTHALAEHAAMIRVGVLATIVLLAWIALFNAIQAGYDRAIASLDAETKAYAPALVQYRKQIVSSKLDDRNLPTGEPARTLALVNLTAFGAIDSYRTNLPTYLRERLHKEYLDGAMARADTYQTIMDRLDRSYRRYRAASRRIQSLPARLPNEDRTDEREDARDRLIEITGGLDPQLQLDRPDYVHWMLTRSERDDMKELAEAMQRPLPGADQAGVAETRIGHVPRFLSRDEYARWARDWADRVVDGLATLDAQARHEAATAAYVPPIAMSLSILGVTLNALKLGAMALGAGLARWWHPGRAHMVGSFGAAVMGVVIGIIALQAAPFAGTPFAPIFAAAQDAVAAPFAAIWAAATGLQGYILAAM